MITKKQRDTLLEEDKEKVSDIIFEEVKRISKNRNIEIRDTIIQWRLQGISEGFYPKIHFEIRDGKEYLCMEKIKYGICDK